MAILRLSALLTPEVMAEVFATFVNELPTSDALRVMLVHAAPDKAIAINGIWTRYITGSGDSTADRAAIRADFADAENLRG